MELTFDGVVENLMDIFSSNSDEVIFPSTDIAEFSITDEEKTVIANSIYDEYGVIYSLEELDSFSLETLAQDIIDVLD